MLKNHFQPLIMMETSVSLKWSRIKQSCMMLTKMRTRMKSDQLDNYIFTMILFGKFLKRNNELKFPNTIIASANYRCKACTILEVIGYDWQVAGDISNIGKNKYDIIDKYTYNICTYCKKISLLCSFLAMRNFSFHSNNSLIFLFP